MLSKYEKPPSLISVSFPLFVNRNHIWVGFFFFFSSPICHFCKQKEDGLTGMIELPFPRLLSFNLPNTMSSLFPFCNANDFLRLACLQGFMLQKEKWSLEVVCGVLVVGAV